MKKYYSLLTREHPNAPWNIEFGDYSKKVVEDERQDSYSAFSKANVKIIATGDTQKEIDVAVAELNKDLK